MKTLKEYLSERTLTQGEKDKAEHIVKGMKKGKAGFRARYGDRAKSVMYATATKLAKEDVEQVEESFMSTYHRNENANRHTANIVHLAKHFGSKDDKEMAKFFADELKRHGHQPHHEAAYNLHAKLLPKALKAHGIKEEVQLDELKSSTLASYTKTAAGDLQHQSALKAKGREGKDRVIKNRRAGINAAINRLGSRLWGHENLQKQKKK